EIGNVGLRLRPRGPRLAAAAAAVLLGLAGVLAYATFDGEKAKPDAPAVFEPLPAPAPVATVAPVQAVPASSQVPPAAASAALKQAPPARSQARPTSRSAPRRTTGETQKADAKAPATPNAQRKPGAPAANTRRVRLVDDASAARVRLVQ